MQAQVIYLTSILTLGIAAQWIAWRLHLPSILLLLGFGFAAGLIADAGLVIDTRELIGDELLFPIVSLSVAVILFEGGLSLRISELRETGRAVLRLTTVTVLVTWVLTAAAAWWLLDFSPLMAALLGAILVVSGPTVIVPLLRHIRPTQRVSSTVKWEGIVNDPIGAVLAVLVLEVILSGGIQGNTAGHTLWELVRTAIVGGIAGFAGAWIMIWLLKQYLLPDFLHNAFFLCIVFVSFAASNWFRAEAGLVTVTVLGIVLANQKKVVIKHVIEFKENLRVLLISTLFILLASRIKLGEMLEVGLPGLIFLLVLLFAVRPAAVFAATIGSELNRKERIFLAWIHPRGIVAAAVSSLFALEITQGHASAMVAPHIAEEAAQLPAIVFLVIVGTVSIYGLTSGPLANFLGLAQRNPQGVLFVGAAAWVRAVGEALAKEGFQVMLVDTNYPNIQAARMAGLRTCYASILSEYLHEEQEFAGLGRLLAVTSNEEVNALSTMAFTDQFGRKEVYFLPSSDASGSRRTTPSNQQTARRLFGKNATFGHLSQRFAGGAQVKMTRLSEDFTYEDFLDRYGPSAIILFIIKPSGALIVSTMEEAPSPQPEEKLIALVDPVE